MTASEFLARWGPRIGRGRTETDQRTFNDYAGELGEYVTYEIRVERERCAKLVESWADPNDPDWDLLQKVAKKIREG